jgi:hypothetical protein
MMAEPRMRAVRDLRHAPSFTSHAEEVQARIRKIEDFYLCAALLTLALILACMPLRLPALGAGVQTAGGLTLQGVVVNTAGHPVAGAYLQSGGFQARTDQQGRYALPVLPRAEALVNAWAPGYNRMAVIFSSPNGGTMQGSVIANFTGVYALANAYQNPVYHASLSGLPVRLSARVHTVHLRGTARVPLESRIAVILPDGHVKTFPLHGQGSHFDAVLTFPRLGVYWVEINATSGFAVFNALVFHGEKPHPPLEPYFPPESTGVTIEQREQYGLNIINQVRETLGRRPLTMQQRLLEAARAHNADIVRYGYYYSHPHIGSDGSVPQQRITRAGLRVRACGEAVGAGENVAATVVSFLESAVHRSILIGHYRWAGVAVAETNGGVLMTVDLAR